MVQRRLAALLGTCLGTAAALLGIAPAEAQDLMLEKVVTLMRHGVRPPTESAELRHYTENTWPSWPVADGQLTPHGAEAIGRLGAWERAYYASHGLLPAAGCPKPGEVFSWANRGYARTIDTGKAMLAAMFPGCGLQIGFAPGQGHDPIFTARQTDAGRMDPRAAEAAILERMGGSFDKPRAELAPLLPELQSLLGCCSARLCGDTAAGPCTFGGMPWGFKVTSGGRNVELEGPLNVGSTMAQVLLLSYMEGIPAEQIGLGRPLTGEDVIRLSAIRKLKYEYMERVPYIARHGASNIARQIAIALEQGAGIRNSESDLGPPSQAKLVLFVGSDTQIAELGALLDAHWQAHGYLDDETPPGGGLSFELLRDQAGRYFVRTVFMTQTPDQIRSLATLDDVSPPVRNAVAVPACAAATASQSHDGACPVEVFSKALRSNIDMTAVSVPAYRQ